MSVRGYRLAADWSKGGGYGGPAEDLSGYLTEDDLVIEVGRDTSQAATALAATTLGFTLNDATKVFAPESSTSVIAGKVDVGVPFVFDLTISGSAYPLYSGILDSFDYDPYALELTGTISDAWGKPSAEVLSTPLYQGQRTGALINVVLDACGWTGLRDIDPGATVVAFWWAEGKDAATAIQELIDAEGPPAIAYVDAGTFVFRDRHHRILDAPCLTSQATFSHIYPQTNMLGSDLKIQTGSYNDNRGRANIVNSATFAVDIRRPQDIAQVWTTDSPISIPANTSVTVFISTSDPFFNAQTPVSTPVFPQEDGTLAPDLVVTSGSVTASIDRTSGASLVITLTAGGTDTVVQSMALRAVPVPVVQTVKVVVEDAGSVASRGRMSWSRPLPWANQYDAYAIAQHIVSVYAVRRPVIKLTIDGTIGAAYLLQFATRKISDRVTIRNDIDGVNGDFFIEKIIRTVKGLGKHGTELTLICEAVDPTGAVNPFTFDVAGKGFNDGQFQADGIDNPTTVFRFDVAGHGFNDGRFAS